MGSKETGEEDKERTASGRGGLERDPSLPSILGSKPRYALATAFSGWLLAVPILGSAVDAILLYRRAGIEHRLVSRQEVTNRITFFLAGLFWCYTALFAFDSDYVFATYIWVICSAYMFSNVHPLKLDEEYGGLFLQGMVFHTILFLPLLLNPYIPMSWINFLGVPASLLIGIPVYTVVRLAVAICKLRNWNPGKNQ